MLATSLYTMHGQLQMTKWPRRTTFFTKHHAYRKTLKYKLCRVVDPSKKMADLNCEVQDLLFEVVDLKQEVPDLRSGGTPHNLTPVFNCEMQKLIWPVSSHTESPHRSVCSDQADLHRRKTWQSTVQTSTITTHCWTHTQTIVVYFYLQSTRNITFKNTLWKSSSMPMLLGKTTWDRTN